MYQKARVHVSEQTVPVTQPGLWLAQYNSERSETTDMVHPFSIQLS